MSSTEAPISITVKTPAGSLVTVRAESGEALDSLIATGLEPIKAAVGELESAVRGGSAGLNMAQAQANIAAAFPNATVKIGRAHV